MHNGTIRDMNPYPPSDLNHEIEQMPVETPQDWLMYLPLAARLWALKQPQELELTREAMAPEPLDYGAQIKKWQMLLKRVNGHLDSLLLDRAREGVWELNHAAGEHLADAVIATQDFACFLRSEEAHPDGFRIVSKKVLLCLRGWIEQAENTALDDEAAESISLFISRFPIREDLRLSIVAAPLSTTAESILALDAEPRRTLEAAWPTHATEPTCELLLLDSGRPTDLLKRRIGRELEIDMGSLGILHVSRRLSDNWDVTIDVESSPEAPVEMVRLGPLPAHATGPNPTDHWVVRLKHVNDLQRQLDILNSPVVICLWNGPRVKIT